MTEQNPDDASAKKRSWLPSRRKMLIGSGATIAGAGLTGLGALSTPGVQRGLIYQPKTNIAGAPLPNLEEPAAYGLRGIVSEELNTSAGHSLLSWHSETLEPGKKTLVFFPGNFGHLGASPARGPHGEDLGRGDATDAYTQFIQAAQSQGYQIMAANHVGYAGSNTDPTQGGMYQGAESVIDALLARGIAPKDMHIVGISMGAPIAAHAAAHLSQSPQFKNDPAQTIDLGLVNGLITIKIGLREMLGSAAETLADYIWHETLDTGKELRDMAASGNASRIRVNYIRGDSDNLTPADQTAAHKDAARGLEFKSAELPGAHYLDPVQVLNQLKGNMQSRLKFGEGGPRTL